MQDLGLIITIVAGLFGIVQSYFGIRDRMAADRLARPARDTQLGPPGSPVAPGNPSTPLADMSGSSPSAPATAPKRRHSLGRHPWIAAGSGFYLALLGVSLAQPAGNDPFSIALGLTAIAFLVSWIAAIVQTIRMKQWGWLVALIIAGAISAFVYGLVGPTSPRKSQNPIPSNPALQPGLQPALQPGLQPGAQTTSPSQQLYAGVVAPPSAPVGVAYPGTAAPSTPGMLSGALAPSYPPLAPMYNSAPTRYCASGHAVSDPSARFCSQCGAMVATA